MQIYRTECTTCKDIKEAPPEFLHGKRELRCDACARKGIHSTRVVTHCIFRCEGPDCREEIMTYEFMVRLEPEFRWIQFTYNEQTGNLESLPPVDTTAKTVFQVCSESCRNRWMRQRFSL